MNVECPCDVVGESIRKQSTPPWTVIIGVKLGFATIECVRCDIRQGKYCDLPHHVKHHLDVLLK